MANLNKVFLIGNLTRNPELFTTNNKIKVTFTLAVNNYVLTKEGERKRDVYFLPIVCWEKLGETCNKFLTKGREVLVEGRIQIRKWTASDNSIHTMLEIVAKDVQFLNNNKNIKEGLEINNNSDKSIVEKPNSEDSMLSIHNPIEDIADISIMDNNIPF